MCMYIYIQMYMEIYIFINTYVYRYTKDECAQNDGPETKRNGLEKKCRMERVYV